MSNRDFLRQVAFWVLLDKLFARVTPVLMALAIIAALAVIFHKGI
jgi:hypothetical protein